MLDEKGHETFNQFLRYNKINLIEEVRKIRAGRSKLNSFSRKLIMQYYKPYLLKDEFMFNDKMTGYLANRDLMSSGDLIEFSSDSFIGKAIRWKTGNDVNHTSMVIQLPNYKTITEPHLYIMEANANGTELNLLSKVLENYKGRAYWMKLHAADTQRKMLSDWMLEHTGIPYDYKSLFHNLIGKVSADANRLFCSETAFLALKFANIIKVPDGAKSPVPGGFKELGCFYSRVQIYG
jgi:hypothetical protein